jgi:hypothetical protein
MERRNHFIDHFDHTLESDLLTTQGQGDEIYSRRMWCPEHGQSAGFD